MKPTLKINRIVAALALAAAALAGKAPAADERNDLRDFRVGMAVADLPGEGYGRFACVAGDGSADSRIAAWRDFRTCPADARGRREVRFEYTATRVEFVKANDKWEGTRVFGHPVLVSLVLDDAATVRGIRIASDPAAPPYLRKKAFLLGQRAKFHFSPKTWACQSLTPDAGETPVGGVYVNERCENRLPDRTVRLALRLYRMPGQGPKDFVNSTHIDIFGADD